MKAIVSVKNTCDAGEDTGICANSNVRYRHTAAGMRMTDLAYK